MGFTLRLYNLKKVKNSTKQPTEADIAAVYTDCYLKDNTSIITPVFVINDSVNTLPRGRYVKAQYDNGLPYFYWIDSMVSIANNLWELHCSLDVLATWKEDIGNTIALVERCSSEYNESIVDVLYPFSNQYNTRVTEYNNPIPVEYNAGYYVVSFRNQSVFNQNEVGTNAYVLTTEQFINILSEVIYNENSQYVNYYGSNANAFASVRYIPLARGAWPNFVADDIYIQSVNIGRGMRFKAKASTIFGDSVSISLRDIISDYTLNDYRSHMPYTIRFLYLPFVGIITLEDNKIGNATSIKVYGNFDAISGAIHYSVFAIINNAEQYIAEYDSSVAMSLPINNTVENKDARVYSTLQQSFGAVTNAFKLNIPGIFDNISHIVDTGETGQNIIAQTNGISMIKVVKSNQNIALITAQRKPIISNIDYVNNYRPYIGRPYYKCVQLKTLSGFIKCINAHVYGTGLDVRSEIDSFLNEGFFYE